jgi:plasmid stabilization system protein ParE
MAASVVWLDQAKDDIRELIEYLFPKNPTAALAYIADLEAACKGLADFPL